MPKRILIFSLAYYPHFVSGAEAAIREITDRIDVSEVEFHMVTLRFDRSAPREERIGTVTVHRVGFGPSYLSKMCFLPLAVFEARRLHRIRPFDRMWALMTYMLLPTLGARMCGVRVPYALTLQDGDSFETVFRRWYVRPLVPLLRFGVRHAAVVQALSQSLAAWPARLGVNREVVVVYNGADPRDVADDVTNDEALRMRAWFGDISNVFLINTARIEYQKGHDTVIRALPLLPPQVVYVMVGSGTHEATLAALAQACGVAHRVVHIPRVSRDEAAVCRKAADIFVGASRSEGLGNAFLSAMASGIPVIATREGGLSEFVWAPPHTPHSAQTAWVVPKDDPAAIAQAVHDILANPEQVRAVTERARRMVHERFDWNDIAARIRTHVCALPTPHTPSSP